MEGSGFSMGGTCFSYEMITSNGIWSNADLRAFSLPLFLMQAGAIVLVSQLLSFVLKPFQQPKFIAEILTGIALGPTVLGKFMGGEAYSKLTPLWSFNILETAGHLGLFFFVFLIALEMDLSLLRRTAARSLSVAAAGTFLAFGVAVFAFLFLFKDSIYSDLMSGLEGNEKDFAVYFVGLLLSSTSLPIVARALFELKLLGTDFGRTAVTAALLTDVVTWPGYPSLVHQMGIQTVNTNSKGTDINVSTEVAVLLTGVCLVGLVVLCGALARPLVWWIQRHTPEGETVSTVHVSAVLGGAMLAGFLADGIGIHYLVGGFAFGLAIPSGTVATALAEMMEEFVVTLMLPLFFASTGLKTDFTGLAPVAGEYNMPSFGLIFVVLISSFAKVGGTVAAGIFHSMQLHEALSLGLLMNCKSLIEFIVIGIGKNRFILNKHAFPMMVLEWLVMTVATTPLVAALYKPAKVRPLIGYKRRNLQRSKAEGELRMLACVHNARNVPAILSLLEVSNPTKRSPILFLALHLVELTGRASAMIINHSTADDHRKGEHNNKGGQSEHIISAFETYEQHAGGVTVQPITAVAPYSSMDEDIITVAGDRRAAVVILPFHKQLEVDGVMEVIHPAIRGLNQKVLEGAPCSVGILVDRGMSGAARYAGGAHQRVAVLFFGGADDREALAYAWRMAEHPGAAVSVVRFVDISGPATPSRPPPSAEEQVIDVGGPADGRLDDECVSEFRHRFAGDESVAYMEKGVSNSEDTVAAIREMDGAHDLYVVGIRQGAETPLTAGLTEWSEHPELGPIGDLLASADFGTTVSVLVLQQYVEGHGHGDMPESPGRHGRHYLNEANLKGRGWN